MSGKGGKPRRNQGIKGRRPDRKVIRCAGAEERKVARDGLTSKEQIARLDRKLGKDVGAKRERARLTK